MTDFEKALVSPAYRWLAIAADGECAETAEYLHRTFQRSNRERRGLALKAIGEGRVAVLVQSLNQLGNTILNDPERSTWLIRIAEKVGASSRHNISEEAKKAETVARLSGLRGEIGFSSMGKIAERDDPKNLSVAFRCFKSGVELEGRGTNSHNNLGACLVAMGDYKKASDVFTDVTSLARTRQQYEAAFVNSIVSLNDAGKPLEALSFGGSSRHFGIAGELLPVAVVNKTISAAVLDDRKSLLFGLEMLRDISHSITDRNKLLNCVLSTTPAPARSTISKSTFRLIRSFIESAQ